MPTGYTAEIADGVSFETFVLHCARNFGALILIRDEPSDAEIPKSFKPTSYHKDNIKKIEKELLKIRKMTTSAALVKAKEEYEEGLKYNEDGIRKAENLRSKYLSMMAKVRAWQPPSPDHIELKKFMDEQITESIEFDCSTKYYTDTAPVLLSGQQWKEKRLVQLFKNLAYHQKEHLEEIERTEGRNVWIKQLRDSLALNG